MFFSFSSRLLSYTGHSLITAVYFYIVEVFTSSKYIRSYDILLENATEILLLNPINFYYKVRRFFCYKMPQFCYKMRLICKIQ